SSRRRHTISKRDWSSDVCSSDLTGKDNTLRFGKYLPAGFSDIQGSDGQVTDCDEDLDKNSTFCNQILPEVTVTGKKQKWSLKDRSEERREGKEDGSKGTRKSK